MDQFLRPGVFCMVFLISSLPRSAGQDSITAYDSLQDARVERLEWNTGKQLRQLQGIQDQAVASIDSLERFITGLQHQLISLEEDNQLMSERLSLLMGELESTRASTFRYRKQLHQTLWISGSVLLFLILASFIYLLLYEVNTRQLLERYRLKQKRVRQQLSSEVKSQEKQLLDALSQQYREVKQELKAQRKKVRKAVRRR